MDQLWLFWAAPLLGAVLGALIHRTLLAEDDVWLSSSPDL